MRNILVFLLVSSIMFAQEICTQNISDNNDKYIVRSINFNTHPVFPVEEGFNGFPFTLLNRIHIDTKHIILAKTLPYSEGDTISASLIMEGKRILKDESYVSKCEINSIDNIDGQLDITYDVWEVWTTKPAIDFKHVAGEYEYGFEFTESNFLGLGSEIWLNYEKLIDDNHYGVKVDIPPLLPKRLSLKLNYDTSPRKTKWGFELAKPYICSEFMTVAKIAFSHKDGDVDRWVSGDSISYEYYTSEDLFRLYYFRAIIEDLFVGSELSWQNKRVELPYEDVQSNNSLSLRIGSSWMKRKYQTDTPIDEFSVDPDIATGISISGSIDFTRYTDSDIVVEPNIYVASNVKIMKSYLGIELFSEYEQYRRESGISLKYTTPSFLWSRLVNDVSYFTYDGNFSDEYYTLGADNRLRGFLIHDFIGSNQMSFNSELRIFPPLEIWSVRSCVIGFIDIGTASDDNIDLSDLSYGAGTGLRITSSKSTSSTILRLEVAYPLSENKSEPTVIIKSELPIEGIAKVKHRF